MSFALGIAANEIDKWAETDLQRYMRHAAKHNLPNQRLEWYHAQQAYISAVTAGGFKGKVTEFLLDAPAEKIEVNDEAKQEQLRRTMFAGFKSI